MLINWATFNVYPLVYDMIHVVALDPFDAPSKKNSPMVNRCSSTTLGKG